MCSSLWRESESEKGQFKPNVPRIGNNGKPIKYESQRTNNKSDSRYAYFPNISIGIWENIAQKNQVPGAFETYTKEQILNADQQTLNRLFYQWVTRLASDKKLDIYITEGMKKACSLMSKGYVAVALPGVYMGTISISKGFSSEYKKIDLIPELKLFFDSNIVICFDQDQKINTIKQIQSAIKRLGKCLEKNNNNVYYLTWDNSLGKGIDDLFYNTQVLETEYFEKIVLTSGKKSIRPLIANSDYSQNNFTEYNYL